VVDGPSFGKRIIEPIVASDASQVAVVNTAFSPDGAILASASVRDNTIRLWDTGTWRPIGEPLTGHDDMTPGAVFRPDGRIMATSDWGGTIRLWDVGDEASFGQPVGEPLTGHTWIAYVLRFTPDGEILVSSSHDRTIRRWDMRDGPSFGRPIGGPLTAPASIVGMDLSPDGRTLATGLGYGSTGIILWDTGTWQPIGPPLAGHTDSVVWLVFSPDGRTLASSSADATIRLWDVDTGRSIGGPLIGHSGTVIVIAIHPDGKTLASSSWDGTIRLWDLDPASWKERVCQIAGRNLTQDEWTLYLPGTPYLKTCEQWPAGE
jgi:WD40 repeat protein